MRVHTLQTRPLRWAPVVAGLLWLGGFELAPTLHMGFHEAFGEHHHGVSDHDPHHHGAETHHHHDHGSLEHEQPEDAPSEHGNNSLAHRDLAAEPSPVAVPPVPEALLAAEQASLPMLRSLRVQPRIESKRARGPPRTVESLSADS